MNQHVPKKFEGFEIPTVPSTEEVHDCGNCLSYQPGTIVCRCDECNDDCVAWDPIPKNPIQSQCVATVDWDRTLDNIGEVVTRERLRGLPRGRFSLVGTESMV